MQEPGGLQSMGSHRVGHDWATSPSLFAFMHWRRKWQPTPVSQSRTRLKRLSSSSIPNPKRWCCWNAALNRSANLENSAVATGLEEVSFHSHPPKRQCQRMPKLPPQFKSINSSALSFLYSPTLTSYMITGKTIALIRWTFVGKVMSLLFNMLSAAAAKSLQPCLTLCNPIDGSPQAPLSLGFSRQECWSGLPFPSPGHLANPGIEPTSSASPALAGGFLTTRATWKALLFYCNLFSQKFSYLIEIIPTLCISDICYKD